MGTPAFSVRKRGFSSTVRGVFRDHVLDEVGAGLDRRFEAVSDLGVEAETLDITRFQPKHIATQAFDEAFL